MAADQKVQPDVQGDGARVPDGYMFLMLPRRISKFPVDGSGLTASVSSVDFRSSQNDFI